MLREHPLGLVPQAPIQRRAELRRLDQRRALAQADDPGSAVAVDDGVHLDAPCLLSPRLRARDVSAGRRGTAAAPMRRIPRRVAALAERGPCVHRSRAVPDGVDGADEERPLDGRRVGPAATGDEHRLVRFADPQVAGLVVAVQCDDPKVAVVLEAVLADRTDQAQRHLAGVDDGDPGQRRPGPRPVIAWPGAVVRARRSSAPPGRAMVS